MTEHKATPHRAEPETWAFIEQGSSLCGYDSCLLELRDRVEALEAAAKPVESNDPAPSRSLTERVADAIYINAMGGYSEQARAAILEVAVWLYSGTDVIHGPHCTRLLEDELKKTS